MIPKVVLDPSFFWLFAETDTEEDAKAAWDSCKPWLKDASHGVPLLVHGKAVERLRDAGMIPAFPGIKEMLERLHLDYIVSAPELAKILDRFLSNMTSLEEDAPVKDVVLEEILIEPACLDAILDENAKEHSSETLSLAALNAGSGFNVHYAFPRLQHKSVEVTASGRIIVADATCELPCEFKYGLQVLKEPSAFKEILDPQEIWDHATTDQEVDYAIRLAAERIAQAQLPQSVIGSSFVKSLRRNQAIGVGKAWSTVTFAKCAQVLASVPELEINEFKDDKVGKGSAKIRKRARDGAGAYRVHVPSGATGLRLMLWQTSLGWEFANVGPKWEEVIEHG